ncbi:CCA-adding enzyme [uncultured Roseburia sp.]|uniref:HDIG domain-containing protein n=1 Tax=Brotonthovivens ammoniilytica TaxID=2981725 RepID=A0ABT2TMB1_9FIRM|nr:HDIG domain-containing metalloprotein [Brotonthovivens ammoniilytica]MCU6762926.1 HDIG domain-containing protein [Brotonthovivens ammoniilytica]SCI94050.1 CCA-adding enzyme [uncultured Roseburia sp.]
MNIKLPQKVAKIIDCLQSYGYEAYAVGGCVRDSILGKEPDDWDITTSAKPEDVKRLFPHTIDTGIAHGTVTVMLGHEGFEVTTYRIDGEYADARHPDEVIFTPDLKEDLKRRDFTINAMAYNDSEGLVDCFGGALDLKNGVIRCVGDAKERFGEDALRMLRAVRFSAQLGFEVEVQTQDAIKKLAPSLAKISAERIQTELVKLLISPHPEAMRQVYELGISDVVLPEFSVMMRTPQHNIHHMYSVGEHTIHALELIRPDKVLRLTMLFHDVAKPVCRTTDEDGVDHFRQHPQTGAKMTEQILRRLRFDNATIQRVTALVEIHDQKPPLQIVKVRQTISRNGLEQYPELFEVKRADICAQSMYQRKEKLAYVCGYERLYEEILRRGDCLLIKDLAVSGDDLIAAGMERGKQIGEALLLLLQDVLKHPEWNQKEILLKRCRQREYF